MENNNEPVNFVCNECNTSFTKDKNLKRHVLNIHRNSMSKQNYICHHCSKSYSTKFNLMAHISKCNKNSNENLKLIECTLCNEYKNLKQNLLNHYNVNHDIDIAVKKFRFNNFVEFEKWKDQKEKDDVSRYVRFDSKKTQDKTIYYYKCNRDGFYKCAGSNIRRLKHQGTTKINGYCPSKITATEDKATGEVFIDFLGAHVGHSKDLNKIPLKKSDRNFLASKISQKIPFDELVNDLRDNFGEDNYDRLHLLTRKDLYNIRQLYKLNKESVRHPNDNSMQMEGVSQLSCSTKSICDVKQYQEKILAKVQCLLNVSNTIEKCREIEKALCHIEATITAMDSQKSITENFITTCTSTNYKIPKIEEQCRKLFCAKNKTRECEEKM